MPCKSDYLDPNQTEIDRKEVSELIVYIDKKLGLKTPAKIIKASTDAYGRDVDLDEIVASLCSKISSLDKKQTEEIVYNAKNKTSRRLADWWEEHQEADKKRLKKELKEAKENKDRDTLIAKLTTYEKRLLGI